jgi:hypothetical protein
MKDDDGLPLDEVGPWAKEKHERLRKYVDISRGARRPEKAILNREQFAKISEAEGIRLTAAAREAFAEFDRRGLSPAERRRAIIGRFKPAGK